MLTLIAAFAAAVCARAGEYYVSPSGNDSAPGTEQRPFRAIQKAADVMVAGDTCFVRAGTYRETVKPKNGGRKGRPIRFVAYPGEVVTLSGTEPVNGDWQAHKGSIYKTKVSRDFVQLFVDGQMMIEARWPNMRFEEQWDRSKWAKATKGSRYGKLRDPELAKTGVDWTGALATLNVTHQFYTWTRFVTGHETGRDYFEYPKDFGKSTEMRYGSKTRPWEDDRYYLSGKLNALDIPTEWFLDKKARTLYLWAEDGRNPASKRVEAKARDYAFEADGANFVELKGFHFFGATFAFRNCSHCVVDGCHLLFPTYARELTELNSGRARRGTVRTWMLGDHNAVRNCSLAFSSTVGLHMAGQQNVVENSLLHDVCWNGSLRYCAIGMSPDRKSKTPLGGTVRRNTVFNCGNAIISYRSQPYVIEYNHVYDGGLACKDVAMIYTGSPFCAGSVVRYNWAHGCWTETGGGLGIRGDDQTRKLTAHHNVVWDCGRDGIIIKGDFNKVHNNTCLFIGTKGRLGNYIAMPTRTEPTKAWRKQHPLLEVQNANSPIFNNAARTINGNQSKRTPFPFAECLGNNYKGEALGLVDPAKWDFRPGTGSALIDAGREIPGFTDGFKGEAPDVGAYEHGGRHWLPGHRNGLWAAAPEGGLKLRVALLMPVLETVELTVVPKDGRGRAASGTPVIFTPQNWMRPRQIRLATPALRLRFVSPSWGEADVPDARAIRTRAGLKVWFEKPDIGPPKPLDTRFNTLHFPAKKTTSPRVPVKPAARAFKTDKPIRIDGRIDPNEWTGWTPERTLMLRPLRDRDESADTAGQALALFDDGNLYVALKMRGAELLREGGEWGKADGVEIDFQPVVGNEAGPVFVLHGFPSGKMESVTDAGASDAQAAKLKQATAFKARIHSAGWDAEFKIPFAGARADPEKVTTMRFNLGARSGGQWFAWARTGRANYAVDRAGELIFRPVCRVSAKNLLRNGDFESENLKGWRATANRGTTFKGGLPLKRVREAANGGWCMKYECEDAELMKNGILKWIYSLGKDKKPGKYVLSYDLRVESLKPRGKGGMFCGYVRTATKNEGQMEHAFSGRDLPWTRRDCVIEIPAGAKPGYVSLQLHKATGTVLIDNVALMRCE